MKSLVKVMLFLGFVLAPLVILAAPVMPHQFFGAVKFTDGVAVPNGMTVEAKINGSVVGSSVTADGNYGYNPNLLFAADNQGVNAGKTVEFYVSGVKANETAIFVNGNSSQINLTIPETLPTTPTPSPAPTGGGGSYTPSSSSIKGDINKDNKIDKYDFALIMANWGKTGSNDSDLNGDNKVDKYDFALLMLNWSK